jgi:hypothetical protein
MTYAILGAADNIYSWNTQVRRDALSSISSNSFGPNGIVKIEGLTRLWATNDRPTATTRLNNGFSGTIDGINYVNAKPDILLYFAYACPPDNMAINTALISYINAGGCVLYGAADDSETHVKTMMQTVFGMQTAEGQTGGGDDNVYPMANIPSDPIINGPFGNLAGKHWGEDNASDGSVVMSSLPPNSVQICTAQSTSKPTIDPSKSIIWYNDSKNFVFFGDCAGVIWNNGSGDAVSMEAYPVIYDTDGTPASKLYGPGGSNSANPAKRFIYNAALELNSVVYLLRKAVNNGINPH